MKRDMDLVRTILLRVEESASPEGDPDPVEVEGYSSEVIYYHAALLRDAGLIDGIDYSDKDGMFLLPTSLTWAGHDFLDNIRDPEIWARTQKGAVAAGGFTFDLLKDLAKAYLKKKIEDQTGMKL